MKLCPGTDQEVQWVYGNLTKCRVCKNFVDYASVEWADGWVDIPTRHYPDGSTPSGRRSKYN